ncbi:MAG: valine--tRNA ligase [Myxococcales bacterium]|nr:valine--tRNA ligase [Myxococcales bacterium]
MTIELSKGYDPTDVEPRWYAEWIRAGHFNAEDTGDAANAYCIAIPPPNVTGSLHMGHALFSTIQDALIRTARMRGFNTLWQPGVDHAGIATEVVVSRLLASEGTSRKELGRERFLQRVWQWKEQSGGRITEQLRTMGASPDWSRERFTMDEQCSRAVREAFVRLYEEGLIYRGERLVNWSVKAQTVISDLEVERAEEDGELFSFAYLFADGSGEIIVATTRPETILGDTAVAVHPDDPRYKDAIGKQLKCPFADRTIPVIADSVLVDMKFGTGAVKVTPAHDFNDYETGRRHSLPFINILNLDGTLNENGAAFAGRDRFDARKAVKKALDEMGLARERKQHRLSIAREARTADILEPMLLPQWYVHAKPLADKALAAVREGKTTIEPEEWVKTWEHWLTNIQEWCISRQLWWGHQIPAWYCDACKEITVARTTPSKCSKCGHTSLKQESDVLDTWFSSALWPFSTLGWPDKTKALETFYPTSVMETGYDILFFWVARMMMFGIHFMGEVPFKRVLLHGMVCDERGEKMSKVKGNVIDPLHLIHGATLPTIVEAASQRGTSAEDALKKFKQCYPSYAERGEGFAAFGADAVRFYLATNPPQATRINLQLRQVERARNFANKLWNATRFALPYLEPLFDEGADGSMPSAAEMSPADRWIVARLAAATEEVNRGLDEFRLDECSTAIRRFFWDELCDWYLELSKPVLNGADERAKSTTRRVLARCLEASFRLLHPIMPFVTEELWQKLPASVRAPRANGAVATHVCVAKFGAIGDYARDEAAERALAFVQGVITAARNIRGELGIKQKDAIALRVRPASDEQRALLTQYDAQIRALTIASGVTIEAPGRRPRGVGFAVVEGAEVIVPLAGLIDPAAEQARLEKEIAKGKKDLEKVNKQLSNENFIARAAVEAVQSTRDEAASLAARLGKLEEALAVVREADAR